MGLSYHGATGLQLRHDHGSQFMSDDFQNEIRFLGIESSPAFVREPEGNGCIERFFKTLKEQLLWVRRSRLRHPARARARTRCEHALRCCRSAAPPRHNRHATPPVPRQPARTPARSEGRPRSRTSTALASRAAPSAQPRARSFQLEPNNRAKRDRHRQC